MHGFFNTAGPTEDFRERKESVKKPCRADANTCPFAHVTVFDSVSATG